MSVDTHAGSGLGEGNQPMRARGHEVVAQPQRAAGNVTAISLEDGAAEPFAGQLEIPAPPAVPFDVLEHITELQAAEAVIMAERLTAGPEKEKSAPPVIAAS